MCKRDSLVKAKWRVRVLEWELEKGPLPVDDSAFLKEFDLFPSTPLAALDHDHLYAPRLGSFESAQSSLFSTREWKQELPPKMYDWVNRHLRFTIFSVYRRLFTLSLLANLSALLYLLIRYRRTVDIPLNDVATAVTANLTVTILMRQELIVNLLFIVFGACPRWAPLRLRRVFAKLYHFGGVHSGCGCAALIWFTLLTALVVRGFIIENPRQLRHNPAILVLTILINTLLVSIIVFAHPKLRSAAHNTFEAVHRFAGWTAVALFWIHIWFLADLERKTLTPHRSITDTIARNPSFWMLCLITICLILPWTRLRKVEVRSEVLSPHAVRIHFTHMNTSFCTAPRISDRPWQEWHSFAAIPEPDGRGFSVLVSNAGDWTRRIISQPPTQLWVRGIPTRGLLAIAPIFERIVLITTGSGIGPCMSLLAATKISCRILWSTQTPESTYGPSIVNDIYRADSQAVVIDTKRCGRPDLVRIAYQMYVESCAEAVFIISNPKVVRKVVYGLESRGVPIFAPVFDS